MKKLRLVLLAAIILGTVAVVFRASPVYAHEGRDVGPYHLVFGWRVEPAYVGVYNGPEVFISMKDDQTKKVEGAEKDLKLEVTLGDQTKSLTVKAAFRDPGHYVSYLTPTRPGDYTFHLTG